MNWRLRDFKVKLRKEGRGLRVEDYIDENGILSVRETDIEYEIKIDYDFQRRLSEKYPEKIIIGKGLFVFPRQYVKKAILHYRDGTEITKEDVTKSYAEYVAKNDLLIPDEDIWRVMKLWECRTNNFENLEVLMVNECGLKKYIHTKFPIKPLKNIN